MKKLNNTLLKVEELVANYTYDQLVEMANQLKSEEKKYGDILDKLNYILSDKEKEQSEHQEHIDEIYLHLDAIDVNRMQICFAQVKIDKDRHIKERGASFA